MPLQRTPDIAAACMLYIQDCTDLYVFVSSPPNSRIVLQFPSQVIVPPHKNFIVVNGDIGGRGDIGLGLIEARISFRCYGADAKTASDMFSVLDWYLLPKDERHITGFTKARCKVYKLAKEAAPLKLVDAGKSDWPFVEGPYIFTYSGTQTP